MKASLTLMFLSLFATSLQAQSDSPVLSSKTQKQLLGEVDQLVQKHFFDKTVLQKIKWHDQLGDTQGKIKADRDLTSFTDLLNSLLAKLQTANTAVFSALEFEYWILGSLFAGQKQPLIPYYQVWFDQSGAKVFIKESTLTTLRRGDLVVKPTIDPLAPLSIFVESTVGSKDTPTSNALAAPSNQPTKSSKTPDNPGSSDQPRQPLVDWEFKKDLVLETISAPTTNGTKDIQPAATHLKLQRKTFDDIMLYEQKTHSRILKDGKRDVGYLRFYAGHSNDLLDHYTKTLDEFQRSQVNALIIDLRFGLGGVTSKALTALLKPVNKSTFQPKFKNIYVLVNQMTTGGKEIFASQLQSELGAIVIGEKTLGAQTTNQFFVLSDKRLGLYLPVAKPDGLGFKVWNQGVTPQVSVRDAALYSSGQDALLRSALKHLAKVPMK